MYLGNFVKNIEKKYSKLNFSGLAFSSKHVKKNNIFFAIIGNKLDGNNYVNDAIRRGASIIISDKNLKIKKKNIVFIKNKNPRKLLSQLSYQLLIKKPKNLVAVTGTNGKSSVSNFYHQILSLSKKKSASIGTIGVQYDSKTKIISNTTLDPIQLREILHYLIKKGKNHIILEASSHGLKQNRLDGLQFDIGIFTNLSHDHLDYHKNMKDYLKSKLYLFDKLIKKKGNVITDASLPQSKKIKSISKKNKLILNLIFDKKNGIELLSHKF